MDEGLFIRQDFELLDQGYQELENDYKAIRELTSGKTDESEILASLQGFSLKGGHDTVVRGLLYGYLLGYPWSNFLFLTSRDNFLALCNALVLSLTKLKSSQRAVELLFSLLKTESPAYPETFLYFLRTMPLIRQILSNTENFINQPMIGMVFYKFLRQAALESEPERQDYLKAINIIWNKQKNACLAIGRDLIRLVSSLNDAAGVDDLWKDLYTEVRDGCPLYWAVLTTPTNIKFHSMLIPPILESKILFIIQNAPPQSFPRYLKWVLETYPVILIPDIVRYIVNYLPTQESSQRWQVIAWLLGAITDHQVQANTKQALAFDCLFFSQNDQIYEIEPCLSLIKYSLAKCPHLAEELLEFLLTSAELYDKRSSQSIMKSLKEVMHLGYLNSFFPPLESLCRHEKIDTVIRSRLTEISEIDSSSLNRLLIQETEDTYISAKRTIMENLGEVAFRHATEPTFDSLLLILNRFSVLGEDLFHFLMKCMLHEYTLPLSLEVPEYLVLYKIFQESENNLKLNELLRYMVNAESAVGVRFLIFSLHINPGMYFKYSDKLERDVRAALEDLSMQCLSWIYRKLFISLSSYLTVGLLHFYLQTANIEQIHQLELDLIHGYYTVIGDNLPDLLEKSVEFTSNEHIFLWKIINAEVKLQNLNTLLEAFIKNLSVQWEALSGFFHYLLKQRKSFNAENVRALLLFPIRNFRMAIMNVLISVNFEVIDEAICFILAKAQFQGQINLLKHLKLWVESESRLVDILRGKNLQNILSSTLHILSSDYFKEFSGLLEIRQRNN